MQFTKGRIFVRKQGEHQVMLLGILLDELPSLTDEMLHDVTIIDDGASITITINRTKPSANEYLIKAGRADQILTGAFMMEGERG